MRRAGDGAGDYGSSHGEGQHGVNNKYDEQEEGHLDTGNRKMLFDEGADFSKRNQISMI